MLISVHARAKAVFSAYWADARVAEIALSLISCQYLILLALVSHTCSQNVTSLLKRCSVGNPGLDLDLDLLKRPVYWMLSFFSSKTDSLNDLTSLVNGTVMQIHQHQSYLKSHAGLGPVFLKRWETIHTQKNVKDTVKLSPQTWTKNK